MHKLGYFLIISAFRHTSLTGYAAQRLRVTRRRILYPKFFNPMSRFAGSIPMQFKTMPPIERVINPNTCSTLALTFDMRPFSTFFSSVSGLLRYPRLHMLMLIFGFFSFNAAIIALERYAESAHTPVVSASIKSRKTRESWTYAEVTS